MGSKSRIVKISLLKLKAMRLRKAWFKNLLEITYTIWNKSKYATPYKACCFNVLNSRHFLRKLQE
jgi:hypothetical protein